MGMLKANDLRAIDWYSKTHGYKLQLSPYPYIYFTDPEGGDVKVRVDNIVGQYKAHKAELSKRRKAGA